MNIANKITLFRIILVPFYIFFTLTSMVPASKTIALVIFVIAVITDKLDGVIARKKNLVTDFGKFLDPIADKLLVCSALVLLTEDGLIPSWITIVIIARELSISAFRLVCAETGKVVAASNWGKVKTIFQMVMIILFLLNIPGAQLFCTIVMYITLALTVISMADYFIKNKQAIKNCSK